MWRDEKRYKFEPDILANFSSAAPMRLIQYYTVCTYNKQICDLNIVHTPCENQV